MYQHEYLMTLLYREVKRIDSFAGKYIINLQKLRNFKNKILPNFGIKMLSQREKNP